MMKNKINLKRSVIFNGQLSIIDHWVDVKDIISANPHPYDSSMSKVVYVSDNSIHNIVQSSINFNAIRAKLFSAGSRQIFKKAISHHHARSIQPGFLSWMHPGESWAASLGISQELASANGVLA